MTLVHTGNAARVTIASGTWFAIEIAAVDSARTIAEIANDSPAPVLFRSADDLRMVGVTCLDGHEDFWKSFAGVTRRRSLFRFASASGNAFVDRQSRSTYTFEHVRRSTHRLHEDASRSRPARGFEGATMYGSIDGASTVIISRFEASSFDPEERRRSPFAHASDADALYFEMSPIRALDVAAAGLPSGG